MHQYIVVAGDLANGFQFFGPWSLEQKDAAETWARKYTELHGVATGVTCVHYPFEIT